MPEGDAIFRFAIRLRADLIGKPLTELFVRHRGVISEAEGRRVTKIFTKGKHTLIHLEAPRPTAVHIHLGMNGRWFRASPGAPRRKGVEMAAAILATDVCEWRCNRPMKAEVLEGEAIARHRTMSKLGPDLLAESVDWEEILRRARLPENERRPIADVLLDQRIACGIGTIYRSESLFAARQNPWAPLKAISDEKLREVYGHAARMLSMNLVPGRKTITTSPDERRPIRADLDVATYVYTRGGDPCLECGAKVEVRRHSEQARKTYYCRGCQIEGPRQKAKA